MIKRHRRLRIWEAIPVVNDSRLDGFIILRARCLGLHRQARRHVQNPTTLVDAADLKQPFSCIQNNLFIFLRWVHKASATLEFL